MNFVKKEKEEKNSGGAKDLARGPWCQSYAAMLLLFSLKASVRLSYSFLLSSWPSFRRIILLVLLKIKMGRTSSKRLNSLLCSVWFSKQRDLNHSDE